MADAKPDDLITLTADIVSAHVANNAVHTSEVSNLITTVYSALDQLRAPAPKPTPEKPKAVVSVRASIKPGFLVSMIDGKPYKMLRRHIGQHGYTPDGYRQAFDLPKDYPMVAADYAEQRRALAHKNGLGRRPAAPASEPTKGRGKLRLFGSAAVAPVESED